MVDTSTPLVVTLAIDPAAQRRFDAERARLFPRSPVGAHVTLFHALPGDRAAGLLDVLRDASDRPSFAVAVSAVSGLGRGTAYRLTSPDLTAVHGVVRAAFADVLTRQDAQPFRPHITVQNKVDPQVARETTAALQASFTPFEVTAVGLVAWRYLGGPWAELARTTFGS